MMLAHSEPNVHGDIRRRHFKASGGPERNPLAMREAGVRLGGASRDRSARQDATLEHADMSGGDRLTARERLLSQREEALRRREEAVRAREAAAQSEAEAAHLLADIREANEHLVVASVQAQTLSEEAEHANHLKDEFLATVSHELRTPLNALLGWIRMLESKQLPPERAAHALAAVGRNAAALAHMIEDLLDTSRILKGTIRIVKQPVDVVTIAQAALDAVRPLAAARNIHLAFEASSGQRAISGDEARLQQVICNLLANAIKFTPESGHVAVAVESSNDHVEIRVVDSGQGISPDFLPHVFERFRQGEEATTQRHTGLGLGLGIVLQLVQLHGGTVHAASPGPGQGATFTVRLPIPAGDAPCRAIARVERRTLSLAAIGHDGSLPHDER